MTTIDNAWLAWLVVLQCGFFVFTFKYHHPELASAFLATLVLSSLTYALITRLKSNRQLDRP